MSIPEQFFGTFQHERSENFEEYLSANGVNWMLRKMINKVNPTKIITDKNDGTYSMTNKTAIKTMEFDFKLNSPFEMEGMDKKTHKVTFELNDCALLERHVRVTEPNAPEEIMEYTRDGDYLVVNVSSVGKDLKCKRFFKKVS